MMTILLKLIFTQLNKLLLEKGCFLFKINKKQFSSSFYVMEQRVPSHLLYIIHI